MTVVKTYCDHCGKELNDMKDCPDIEVGILDYRKADFCQKCLSELQGMIDEFIKEDLMK